MSLIVLVVCLSAVVSARPIFSPDDDQEFLRLTCEETPFLATISPECRLFFSQMETVQPPTTPSNQSALVPTVPALVLQTANLASWAKAVLGVISFIVTAYSSAVTYIKYTRKVGVRRALVLDLCGAESIDLDAHSHPVQVDPAEAQVAESSL